jgi:hypothetical protein
MDIPLVAPVLSPSTASSDASTKVSPSPPPTPAPPFPVYTPPTVVQVQPPEETSTGVKIALGLIGVSVLGVGIYLVKKQFDDQKAADDAALQAQAAAQTPPPPPTPAPPAPTGPKPKHRKGTGHGSGQPNRSMPAVMSGLPASMPTVPTSVPGMPASLPVAQQALGTLGGLGLLGGPFGG